MFTAILRATVLGLKLVLRKAMTLPPPQELEELARRRSIKAMKAPALSQRGCSLET